MDVVYSNCLQYATLMTNFMQVLIETVSVSVRTVIFTCLVLWKPSAAVVAFSVAQIASQICYAAAYCGYFRRYVEQRRISPQSPDDFPFTSLRDFLPKKPEGQVILKKIPVPVRRANRF